jgi:hypothetical protein
MENRSARLLPCRAGAAEQIRAKAAPPGSMHYLRHETAVIGLNRGFVHQNNPLGVGASTRDWYNADVCTIDHHIKTMCGRVIQSSGPLRYAVLEGLDVRDSRVHNCPPRWNGRRAKTCW